VKNRKSFVVLLLQLIQTALAAATVIYLARILQTDEYGRYVYYLTAASVVPLLTGLGGEHVFLMQASRDSKLIPVLFGSALFVRGVLTVLVSFIAAAILFLGGVSHADAIILIVTGCLLTAFSNPLFLSFYRVKGIHIRPWIILFLNPLTFFSYLLVLPKSFVSVQAVSLGFVLSQVVPFCVFLVDVKGRVSLRISWECVRKFSGTGMMFSLSQAFDYLFSRVDIFLIQIVLGPFFVGVYAAGQRVVSLFQLIPSSFHVVELPEFHRAAENKPLLVEKFRSLRRLLLELAALFFGLMILNSAYIVGTLFKETYKGASSIVVLLSLSSVLLFVNYPYYMLAEAINKIRQRLFTRIYTFLLTIVFVFVFAKYYGANGAALGMILGQLVFLLLLHQITKECNAGLRGLLWDARSLAIASFAFLVAYGLGDLLRAGFLKCLLVSTAYTIIVFIVGTRLGLIVSLASWKELTHKKGDSAAEQPLAENARAPKAANEVFIS